MNKRKMLRKLVNSPAGHRFDDLRRVVEAFGFRLGRVSGSHHIFVHPEVDEVVNVQEVGGEAKAYQVKQFLALVERHNLRMDG